MSSESYTYTSDNDDSTATTEEFVDLIGFDNYEILNVYPYTIRRKDNKRVVSEYIDRSGYYRLCLNTKNFLKHRIIAQQFIDNPNNLPVVDHINRIRTDNHLENLRWCSVSDNNRNVTKTSRSRNTCLKTAPNDITEILLFNDVQYNSNTYFFCFEDDSVYKRYNDHKWLKLQQTPLNGYLSTTMYDINRRSHRIYMHTLIKHFRTEVE